MKKLLLILVTVWISACGSVDNVKNDRPEDLVGNVTGPETYGEVDVPHFIMEYALTDEAYPDVISRTVGWRGDDFVFCVYGSACRWVTVKDTGDDALLYESLCERFGDMTYDKVRNFTVENIGSVPVAGIMDAVAVCKKTGAVYVNIADKCHFCTMTLRPYIESGYVDTYDWTQRPQGEYFDYDAEYLNAHYAEYHPLSKPLSECTPEDRELICMNGERIHLPAFYIIIKDAANVLADADSIGVALGNRFTFFNIPPREE